MTLTELRYIIAVSNERHFGRAAESCFVSQPTLSVAIKKLEEELGISIFERRKHEVHVTSIGARIITQAKRTLEEAETIKVLAHNGRNQLNEPFHLGAIYTIGPYLLPHLVPSIVKTAPKMPLRLQENFTAVLSKKLKQGEIDAIIVAAPFEEPGILTVPLYEENFVVLLPSDHPWKEQRQIEPHQLEAETLLLLGAGHCFRDQVLDACPGCNNTSSELGLQQTVEGSSLETIRHMVASHMGITVLPATAAETHVDNHLLTTIPLSNPAPSRTVLLAWRASFPRPKAIDALRQAFHHSALPNVRRLDKLPTI